MVDPKMNANSPDARYIGIFKKKDGSIVRQNYTSGQASMVAFEGAWKSKEYVTGLMAHTRLRWTGHYKSKYTNVMAR